MGSSGSKQYDIGTLELAFWYARLMEDGDHARASDIAPQIDPQLLTDMAGSGDNGLQMVRDLIMSHPQAGQLPYFGDPASDQTLQQLLKAKAGAGPTGDTLLNRQIQVAARADGDGGAAYIEQRIAERTVASYVTSHGSREAPVQLVATEEETQRAQRQLANERIERGRVQAERAIRNDDLARDARVLDRARYDPRVMTALQNAAVRNIINRRPI